MDSISGAADICFDYKCRSDGAGSYLHLRGGHFFWHKIGFSEPTALQTYRAFRAAFYLHFTQVTSYHSTLTLESSVSAQQIRTLWDVVTYHKICSPHTLHTQDQPTSICCHRRFYRVHFRSSTTAAIAFWHIRWAIMPEDLAAGVFVLSHLLG